MQEFDNLTLESSTSSVYTIADTVTLSVGDNAIIASNLSQFTPNSNRVQQGLNWILLLCHKQGSNWKPIYRLKQQKISKVIYKKFLTISLEMIHWHFSIWTLLLRNLLAQPKNQRKLLMSNVNPQRLYQVRQLFQFLLKVMEKIKQAKNTTPVQCLKLFMRCTTLARENLMNLQNLPPMLKQASKKINLEMSQDNPHYPFILQNY